MCIRDRYTAAFQDRIRKWVEKGRIRYIPKASQKELALIYRNSDIFVFTSNYEIFGMVLLEALYFGLPVISSANGGASVLIREGENGFMMQGFHVPDWERKLTFVLELSLIHIWKSGWQRMTVKYAV